MKTTLSLVLLAASLASGHSQGTMQFVAQITGNSGYTGDGTFSLITNFFTYDVLADYGFNQGQIRSPWPDTNALAVFDLNLRGCLAPLPPDPGGCSYRGSRVLSDQEVADLQAGRWYVHVLAAGSPFFGVGQILPVPEPCGAALFYLGLGMLWLSRLRRASRAGASSQNQSKNKQNSKPIVCLFPEQARLDFSTPSRSA